MCGVVSGKYFVGLDLGIMVIENLYKMNNNNILLVD